jgi:hypothetical protein
MKSLISLIIMLFTLSLMAQESYLSEQDRQKQKDLRNARLNELQKLPYQSLDNTAGFGYLPVTGNPIPTATTVKNGSSVWLNWDNGINSTAIGSESALNWDIAIRFDSTDLQGLEESYITQIRVFISEEALVTLKIWQGANDPTEIYAQDVSEYNTDNWTDIELFAPVAIDPSQDLWVGYNITSQAGSYTAGVGEGTTVTGKGDLFQVYDQMGFPLGWETLSDYVGPIFNWNIQALAETIADGDAPAAPENFIVSAGANGQLSATLAWTNPSLTFNGEELSSLENIFVYRGPTLIQTINNPLPGAAESFTDEVVTSDGFYTYRVTGENQAGEGAPSSNSVYVGEDLPSSPTNITLVQEEGNVVLSWLAPQTGINNGYINPALTTYSVTRFPGEITIAEDLSVTTFTDTQIPNPGNYYYRVTASNNRGTGGIATSSVIALGSEDKLFFEAFDYSPGTFPLGWRLTGTTEHSWYVDQTNMAGGIAPELVLSWNPEATGISRLVSPSINSNDYTGLRISLRQYLANYHSYENEAVALEFTTDGGVNWETIWEQTLESEDIMQDVYDFTFYLPENTASFQIALRFQGNSFNVDYWYIDEISIEPLLGNNLAAVSLSGSNVPSVGTESIYTALVSNMGEFAATDYTVKLMGEGDIELASVSGQALQPGQNRQYELPWTPAQSGNTAIYAQVDYDLDEFAGNNITSQLQLQVQPEGTLVVEVGEENFQSNSIPINFFWRQSIAQTIYLSEEIEMVGGAITALRYQSVFAQNIGEKEIRVWLGETDLDDLSQQEIDSEDFILVFEGLINFPNGQNEILIPFDNPYPYGGRNLVVFTDKEWDDNFYGPGNAFVVSNDSIIRSRTRVSDEPISSGDESLGSISFQYPNTTFFFSLEGLGGIEGSVTQNNEPVEGVKVKIANKPIQTLTNESGFYTLPNLLAGEYGLEISKFGYFPKTISNVIVAEDETTTVDIELEAIPQYTVFGKVEGNDGLIPANVTISLSGYNDYSLTTDVEGLFETGDVYEGEYLLSVYAPGYDFYRDENFVVTADTDLGVIILAEIILAPNGLIVDYDNYGAGNALLSWNQAGEPTEFRYDSGIASNIIGTSFDSFDAIVGTAHPNAAVLFEMSWVISNGSDFGDDSLSNEVGNNETVRIKIFGLDDNNLPDRNQLLYSSDDIAINNSEWTTYQFSEPVNAPNGFFMGISTESFLFLLTDNGQDPDWPFQNNTHFVNFDVTSDDFYPLELFGYQENFFIRANGYDLGIQKSTEKATARFSTVVPDFNAERIAVETFNSGSPFAGNSGPKSTKAFTGYNVYLNDLETPVAFTEDLEFLFTEIPEGNQVAGVQSVYTTGVSEIVTLDFEVVYPVEVTLNVSTNNGATAEGAAITLANQQNSNYNYSAMVDETGIVFFESVRKGTYTLQANFENYQSQQITGLVIQEVTEIGIEFIELIDPPVNLMVLTEGLEGGQALFSWNNPTHGWAESFEDGVLPENWSQIITNTGNQAGYDATWRIVETVDFSNNILSQNGSFQAYIMWSFEQQDEWLISPEFTAPAGDLVFWYHGINGSTFGDNYFVKISDDGGSNWTTLWNASNLPSGLNHYSAPVAIDLSFYAGKQVKLAWHADDGPEDYGLWSSWAIDNITVGGDTLNLKDFAVNESYQNSFEKNALGYNVYLDGTLVAENVQDTQFLFNNIADGPRVAGVEAVYATGTSGRVIKEFILSETSLLSLASNPAGSSSLSGAAWYAEGSEALVNALPNDGFTFVNWTTITGEVVSDQPSFLYTMPGNDVLLIANFEEIELFSVTFNIDMTAMPGYNPFANDVALTGSMHNWAVLGANHRNQTMAGDHTSMIYTKTFTLSPGTYQYKYFLNEGEYDEEWEDGDNREIIVNNNIVVNDVWGVTTQVENVSAYDQVRVFPNPFNNHLEIRGADNAERIIITNILGKVVVNEFVTGNLIDTSALPAGVYLIYLEGTSDSIPVQKVVKH